MGVVASKQHDAQTQDDCTKKLTDYRRILGLESAYFVDLTA
ncbi:protein of unknown function [Vibrio tapetis subsp. tapetis]|uniref:Uncharacterized protein n=1 Tax=Vibrio tapetis subsp. tapetis TaxID=1671868 RepID=A0A2N8ZKY7_9VIBR|nr:protein of unknown function [Vibrio tapetis subsp. tapetis]